MNCERPQVALRLESADLVFRITAVHYPTFECVHVHGGWVQRNSISIARQVSSFKITFVIQMVWLQGPALWHLREAQLVVGVVGVVVRSGQDIFSPFASEQPCSEKEGWVCCLKNGIFGSASVSLPWVASPKSDPAIDLLSLWFWLTVTPNLPPTPSCRNDSQEGTLRASCSRRIDWSCTPKRCPWLR